MFESTYEFNMHIINLMEAQMRSKLYNMLVHIALLVGLRIFIYKEEATRKLYNRLRVLQIYQP